MVNCGMKHVFPRPTWLTPGKPLKMAPEVIYTSSYYNGAKYFNGTFDELFYYREYYVGPGQLFSVFA